MKPSNPKVKRVRPLLGTYVEIELRGTAPAERMHTWITAGFEMIEEIDRLMSFFRPGSDISLLNHAASGEWINVHAHTLKVLKASNELYRTSEGAFDIRFRSSSPAVAGRGSIHGPPTETFGGDGFAWVRKTGPWTLDLGGIAKGYAVDCAVERIKNLCQGRQISGVVNAGGDLRRWGKGAQPIAVATSAVRTPDIDEGLSPAHHMRMPKGEALKRRKAVTVFADQCLWSDALTKVMMLASKRVADGCLKRYHAHGLVLA